jgi:hypothetical protein
MPVREAWHRVPKMASTSGELCCRLSFSRSRLTSRHSVRRFSANAAFARSPKAAKSDAHPHPWRLFESFVYKPRPNIEPCGLHLSGVDNCLDHNGASVGSKETFTTPWADRRTRQSAAAAVTAWIAAEPWAKLARSTGRPGVQYPLRLRHRGVLFVKEASGRVQRGPGVLPHVLHTATYLHECASAPASRDRRG